MLVPFLTVQDASSWERTKALRTNMMFLKQYPRPYIFRPPQPAVEPGTTNLSPEAQPLVGGDVEGGTTSPVGAGVGAGAAAGGGPGKKSAGAVKATRTKPGAAAAGKKPSSKSKAPAGKQRQRGGGAADSKPA